VYSGIRHVLVACLVAVVGALPASSLAAAQGKIKLQWFGQSATKITTVAGKVIVIDPWLTKNPLTPPKYKNLDAIGKMDILLVTHAMAIIWAMARSSRKSTTRRCGDRRASTIRCRRSASCRRTLRRAWARAARSSRSRV